MSETCSLPPPIAETSAPELVEVLGGKETRSLYDLLQKDTKKEIILGAGGKKELTVDEAIKQYMEANYPNLETASYCFPPQTARADDSSGMQSTGERLAKVTPDFKILPATSVEFAEETVVGKFFGMLTKNQIPSFLIHGHRWKTVCLEAVMMLSNKAIDGASELVKELSRGNDEGNSMDFLISSPDKCILSVGVNPVEEDQIVAEGTLKETEFLRGITGQFVSTVCGFPSKVTVVKVIALPNCTRATVGKFCCEKFGRHVVTTDELSTSEALFDWFTNLLQLCAPQAGDVNLSIQAHRDLVNKLVGSASFIEARMVRDFPKAGLENEEKNRAQTKKQWLQLTPDQLYVKYKDPQFLLLTGVPGSGKTLLGVWKAVEILQYKVLRNDNEKSSKGSVLYIITETDAERLKDFYKLGLKNTSKGNCKLVVKDPMELPEKFQPEDGLRLQMLPSLIKDLQKKHKGQNLHIIYDGCSVATKDICRVWFQKDMKNLDCEIGYIWILQDNAITEKDSRRSLPGFETIHLGKVMRTPGKSIGFTNMLIDRNFQPRHTVSGNKVLVYRMSCVCEKPKETCCVCYTARLAWLCKKGKDMFETGDRRLGFSDYVLLTRDVNAISYALHLMGYVYDEAEDDDDKKNNNGEKTDKKSTKSDKPKNVIYCCDAKGFSGCERKIVLVDFDTLCDDTLQQIVLTRSTGFMIILDGGCNSANLGVYKARRKKVTELAAAHPGLIEIKKVEPTVLDGFMFDKMLDLLNRKDDKKDEKDDKDKGKYGKDTKDGKDTKKDTKGPDKAKNST